MTQANKELILKDLCGRLPYGVKVQHQHEDYLDEIQTIERISRRYGEIETESVLGFVDDFKPYLRSMSSMTEEEEKEFVLLTDTMLRYGKNNNLCCLSLDAIQWLLKNHFDFMGLIPKGLAIEVTKENNPYKE